MLVYTRMETGGSNKWSDFGYILKAGQTEFPNGRLLA